MDGGQREDQMFEGGGGEKNRRHGHRRNKTEGDDARKHNDFINGQKFSEKELKKLEIDLGSFSRDDEFSLSLNNPDRMT